MKALGLIFFIFFVVVWVATAEDHNNSIENKIDSIGGRLISYEERVFFQILGHL